MIAADTSAWIDYAKGINTYASNQLEKSLQAGNLVIPTPVLFEILSGPGLTSEAEAAIEELPTLELLPDFWKRAGQMRRILLQKKFRAHAMDCLIAQNCIDHDTPLIVSDYDYRHFVKFGLKIV